MKINVEVDCTPEEARRVMGLPDLTLLHEKYLTAIGSAMDGHVQPEVIDAMMRSWAPMSEAGINFWRGMFDVAAKKPG